MRLRQVRDGDGSSVKGGGRNTQFVPCLSTECCPFAGIITPTSRWGTMPVSMPGSFRSALQCVAPFSRAHSEPAAKHVSKLTRIRTAANSETARNLPGSGTRIAGTRKRTNATGAANGFEEGGSRLYL